MNQQEETTLAIRTILLHNDATLRKTSREITAYNKRIHDMLDDMKETLIEAAGIGLAAPQVGILRRVFIIVNPETGELTEFINPEIIEKEGEQEFEEG